MSMKIQQLGQLITQAISAQQPGTFVGNDGCVESVYIEQTYVNGKLTEKTVRTTRGTCLPATENGIKITDGLFLKNHMTADKRTNLVKKYENHRKAIIIIAQNGSLSGADLTTLVNDFNRLWSEQTTSVGKINTSALDARLSTLLEPMIDKVFGLAKKKVPEIVDRAIQGGRSSAWNIKGLDYYLDRAASGEWDKKGLEYHLERAASGEWNKKGLEYYLERAASGEWNEKGLKYHLERAASGEWNVKGLKYWKRQGMSSEWNEKGYGYLKKYEDKCRIADWKTIESAHKTFTAATQKDYDAFVKGLNATHDAFVRGAKAGHQSFGKAMKAHHETFKTNAQGIYGIFKKKATALKPTSIAALDKLQSTPIVAENGYARLSAIITKMESAPESLRTLRKTLKDAHNDMSSKLEAKHTNLSRFFSETSSSFHGSLEDSYTDLSRNMEQSYKSLTRSFETSYDTLRSAFDAFLRKYD